MALIYTYLPITDSYEIDSDICPIGEVVIPSTHDNGINGLKNVTAIASLAFNACTSLTSVIIPNTVTLIRGSSFLGTSLTSLIIPDSVRTINEEAFYECTSLTSVVIGRGITVIRDGAFGFCTSLIKVNFLGNAPTLQGAVFVATNANIKIYRKKNFVTGWSSTFGGKPVVLISDNVIKSGGTGKLTTKKRN